MKRKLTFVLGLLFALTGSVFAQFDADKTYTICNNNDANMFMQDMGNGGSVALGNSSGNIYWKFVATENADCYYIQNATTGKFIQGYDGSEQEVATGDTGVEYYIKADAEGSLEGKFRMSCTANTPYDFSSGTLGLNWKNNNTVQSFASVAGGNPRSAWIVTEQEMPQPEQPTTLSSPWVGTDVAEGEFYLYNVESGLWLQNNDSKSEDWSTRAAIGTRGFEWNILASDGAYALQPNFYINGTSNLTWSINPGNNYIDTNDGQAWEFHAYDAMRDAGISNAFTINCGNKVLGTVKYNEGARQENLFTQEGDDRWYLENPDYNINMSERITWQLVTKQERLEKMMAEASVDNPVDASWLIPGPDFANNDKRYEQWTRSLNGGNGRSGDGGVHGSRCIESWNSGNIDFSVTLNVPNGTYRMQVQGYYRDGNKSDVVARRTAGTETIRSYYFANEVEHPLMSILDGAMTAEGTSGYAYTEGGFYFPDSQNDANRCFNLHKGYVNEEIEVVVTTGSLKIGIKKAEGVANDWTVFDNFKLTYLGNNIDLSDYVNALEGAIDQAEKFDASTTSTILANELADALADAKSKLSSTNPDELSAAVAALNAALEAAQAVNVIILKQTAELAEAEGLDVTAANTAIAEAKTAADIDQPLYDLRAARKINALRMPDIYTGSAPAEGKVYIFNLGTGMFLGTGSDWNTHAAVDQVGIEIELIADGENFKMKTNRGGGWLNYGGYVDTGGQDTWHFLPVAGKDNVYNISSTGEDGYLLGYDPNGRTDGKKYWSTIAIDRTGLDNPMNQWKVITPAERDELILKAAADQPIDVSYLVKNASLNRQDGYDMWQKQCDGGNGGARVSTVNDNNGDRATDYAWEYFEPNSFRFTQTIEGLAPGNYVVSVQGFFRNGNGEAQANTVNEGGELVQLASLVANDQSVLLPNIASVMSKVPGIGDLRQCNEGEFPNMPQSAIEYFENGYYKASVPVIVAFDGKLTIGVKKDTKELDGDWTVFDNFRLTYLGPVEIETMSILGDFTGGWELENAQDMTQDSENPAIWTLTVDNFKVEIEEGQTERKYEYKATANHMWGAYELPATGNQDWVFGSDMYPAGEYKLVFTADTENHTLSLSVEKAVVDAISELNADTTGRVVFNLQGQKMQQTNKGLYIINGNKVVIK